MQCCRQWSLRAQRSNLALVADQIASSFHSSQLTGDIDVTKIMANRYKTSLY
jgi:hypothetical protein